MSKEVREVAVQIPIPQIKLPAPLMPIFSYNDPTNMYSVELMADSEGDLYLRTILSKTVKAAVHIFGKKVWEGTSEDGKWNYEHVDPVDGHEIVIDILKRGEK